LQGLGFVLGKVVEGSIESWRGVGVVRSRGRGVVVLGGKNG
nr:hypothetical protein [Tanacetum cinerariifolium]